MDNATFFLKIRAITLWGESFCKEKKIYGSEKEALKEIGDNTELSAWPCPFCRGDNLVVNDQTLSLKGDGWHIGPNLKIEELETITEMTAEVCLTAGYAVSNKRLLEHIGIFDDECLFENYNANSIADPEIRKFFDIAEKAYFSLKDAIIKKTS